MTVITKMRELQRSWKTPALMMHTILHLTQLNCLMVMPPSVYLFHRAVATWPDKSHFNVSSNICVPIVHEQGVSDTDWMSENCPMWMSWSLLTVSLEEDTSRGVFQGISVTVEEPPISFSPFSSANCTMFSHFSFNDFIVIAFPDLAGDLDVQI